MAFCSTEELHDIYKKCGHTVSTDTRNIGEGSMFFCLKGANFDGNKFAAEALSKGAAFVVADDAAVATSSNIVLVQDVLTSLQQLAAYHRRQIKTHILGIGGSNGKTTTKELCAIITGKMLKTKATKGNLNNHIGVPLTLLALDGTEDLGIVEMGTNNPGEMEFLCNLVNPDSGIVTNVGKEHLEGFGDLEGVAKEESILFHNLLKNNGKAFVNSDDPWLANMGKRLTHSVSYGINHPCDLRGELLSSMPHLEFKFHWNGASYGPFTAHLGGSYNLSNILPAIGVGIMLGLEPEYCAQQACAYEPTNNRSEWLEKGDKKILLDAYNANPSSMEAALREFAALKGSRAVFLGDMLELGHAAEKEHKEIFELCKRLNFNEIYLCGEEFRKAAGSYPHVYDHVTELGRWLKQHPSAAEYALVKGSRGIRMEEVLDSL